MRRISVADVDDVFQGSYVLIRDKETNAMAIADSGSGIPISYEKHMKIRNLLNDLFDSYGEELKEDLEEVRERLYTKWNEEDKHFNSVSANAKPSHRTIQGYVYIVKMGEYYKVGKTLDMTCRMGEYTLLPIEPEIVFCKKVEDYTQGERTLHEQYAEKRVRGEWFKLSDSDIKKAKKLI